ncbi:N-acetyltransferase family protein [Paeniglutamicibacter sp. R2-26]|uniref:GNAT family N-acetyltransferase n=1 Tax=Paeniglutamicibacter sp. R2-26 TaxID=3144417 RepID=UPI003EE66B67
MTDGFETDYYVGQPAKGDASVGAAISDPNLVAVSESDVLAAAASASRLKERRLGFRVAKSGKQVVGFAGFGPFTNREGKTFLHGSTALLARLVVEEAHRSQGLGVRLIQAAEEAAKTLGFGLMVSGMTDAGAAAARKAGWTVLDKTERLTWLEPETPEEVAFLPAGTNLNALQKVAGMRHLHTDSAGDYPNLAYKELVPPGVLKIVVYRSDGSPEYLGDPFAEAALAGSMGLSDLPFSGFARFLPDIFRQGGYERTLELCTDWVSLNQEQAKWIAGLFDVDLDLFAKKLADDMEYAAKR